MAVPETLFREVDKWQLKKVRVRGTALAMGSTDPDLISLQYRDRYVSPHVCGNGGFVLYVDSIERER